MLAGAATAGVLVHDLFRFDGDMPGPGFVVKAKSVELPCIGWSEREVLLKDTA